MEDSTKKVVSVVVIVVCLVAAGAIVYKTRAGGGGEAAIQRGVAIWVKCNNTKCGYEYQMDQKDYYDFIMKDGTTELLRSGVPPLKCEKCGEASVFRAVKCEKCGKVFFPGAVQGKYDDKCPGCGFSQKEEMMKKAPTGGQGGPAS